MKKILFSLAIATAFIIGCSTEETHMQTSEAAAADTITLAYRNDKITPLFTFSDDKSFSEGYAAATMELSVMADALKPEYGASHMVVKIVAKDSVAFLEEIHFLDDVKEEVIYSEVLNYETGVMEARIVPGLIKALRNLFFGSCPPGHSYLGTCNYGSDMAYCIGVASSQVYAGHMSPGHSVSTYTSFGLFAATVCGSNE